MAKLDDAWRTCESDYQQLDRRSAELAAVVCGDSSVAIVHLRSLVCVLCRHFRQSVKHFCESQYRGELREFHVDALQRRFKA